MKLFQHLALPIAVDLRGLLPTEYDPARLGHFHQDPAALPPELLQFLTKLGIEVPHAEIFYTPPWARLPIHTDGDRFCDKVKLNWQYGAAGSVMNWFRLRDPELQVATKKTIINTNYLQPTAEQCVFVASTKIGAPTLVNVGRPHSVINSTAQPRWVVSVVLGHNGASLEMPLALELFKDYFK